MRATCPACGQDYPGGQRGGHCRECCETFASDASGDAHRVGPYEPRGARRCLSVAEMLAGDWPERASAAAPVPWRRTPRGWTSSPPLTAEQLEKLRGVAGITSGPRI